MLVNYQGFETLTPSLHTYMLQLLQFETGKVTDILQQYYNKLKDLTIDLQIKSFWEFVYKLDISIRSPKKVILAIISRGDKEIINEFEKLEYVVRIQCIRIWNNSGIMYRRLHSTETWLDYMDQIAQWS